MGIQGRASLMMMNKDTSDKDYEHLKEIDDYVHSASNLTKQLLGFARGGKYFVNATDLNELVKKQNVMFGRTRKELNITGSYEPNLWAAEVDQGQIEQVLINLYVNASHAMPDGGDIHVQTENVTVDDVYGRLYKIKPGRYVKISVKDTGIGMDKKTQEKIFDPFFTTKEVGRGTGLGLASVYGIIKSHRGLINVYSELGEGTVFNIYLPATQKEIDQKETTPNAISSGTEVILLVDDEEFITVVGKRLLEKLGYRVFTAISGSEAVEFYSTHKDVIDLIILDVVMPEMGGGKTFDLLKKIDPDVKVLLASGYGISGQAADILKRGCRGFIQKPFTLSEVSQKLREILD
jgi:CheY-like chemotaxis protein